MVVEKAFDWAAAVVIVAVAAEVAWTKAEIVETEPS